MDLIVEALVREIQLREDFFGKKTSLETVYFGGGTPSILPEKALGKIWDNIQQVFDIAEGAEITLEANPDDLNKPHLHFLKSLGINRLSIGIQSLVPEELNWMNRSHTVLQAIQCIEDAQDKGISNISVDLIFGTPYTDLGKWQEQLKQVVEMDVPHISLYALTIEEKTALHNWLKKDSFPLPDDALAKSQFLTSHYSLEAVGYSHYELSNYAKEGFFSRHNSAYWSGEPFLGIGPSAHSFDGKTRMANVAHNSRYSNQLKKGFFPFEWEEELSEKDRYNEYIMTQLRTAKGISSAYLRKNFGKDIEEEHENLLIGWKDKGWIEQRGTSWVLSPEGWWMSDGIIRELFD